MSLEQRAKSRERKAESRGLVLFLLLLLGFLPAALFGCNNKTTAVRAPTKLTVRAIRVDKAPKLDGAGTDTVWRQAPAAVIPTAGGADLVLKSVYTAGNIYFLARWSDKTPQAGTLWWEFDGARWRRNYETDDKISLIWNIDRSIPAFDKKGCQAICHKSPSGPTMQVLTARELSPEREWPGIKWMADAWKWAPGVMQVKSVVDDGLFAAPRETRQRPEAADSATLRLVFDGGDEGTKQWFTRNPNGASAEEKAQGISKPAFMPKPGLDLASTPFPNLRDMVQITDYSIFKAGDRLPMMVFFDLTNEKNKNDFPAGRPSGSRVDLSGQAVYKDSRYTLEFGRKLDTKHSDDVQFRPESGRAVAENVFGAALFNDTRFEHTTSQPVTLILEP